MEKTIYDKMADKIFLSGSKLIPQLFEMIADKDEAELLMSMPGSPEDLAKGVGKSVDQVDGMCRTLYVKGLAFKSLRDGQTKYKMCRDLIQFHDGTILWPEATKAYHDLWQTFMETEWPDYARMITKLLPTAFTRVIAVEEAVDPGKQKILDMDSVNTIIDTSEVLAVTKCTCRVIAHKCDMPVEACIQVGNAARYTLDRGTGREITKEEAYALIKTCEEKGLVHVTMNKSHVGHFICNCCECCCQTLPLIISERLNLTAPSRFCAQVDPEACSGCGTCVDRCKFKAIDIIDDVAQINEEFCLGCGLCYGTCPETAIRLVEKRPVDFIPQ
ncbi:MAG: 4Fe-4S binding protein [Proteobacteria bacterium]|nr:4Fe-4S binding protein [Pseudomonadota bacterium]